MKVTATVVWPVTFEIEVDDEELKGLSKDDSDDLVRDKILSQADDILNTTTIKPVIQECSLTSLEE